MFTSPFGPVGVFYENKEFHGCINKASLSIIHNIAKAFQ